MTKSLFVAVIIFAMLTILCSNISNEIWGKSSSFLRQEIQDDLNDIYDLQEFGITDNITRKLLPIDIIGASYVSDGRFLNGTIWITGAPNQNYSYILMIDSDSNPKTGGKDGGDYVAQISFSHKEQKWKETLLERSSFSTTYPKFRVISEKLLDIAIENPVHISIDLRKLNFPSFSDVVFIATDNGQYQDFTSWAHIPPPKILISFSENPVNIRPGETKIVNLNINSTTGFEPGFEPKIHLSSINDSRIGWGFNGNKSIDLFMPSYGSSIIPLKITLNGGEPGQQFFFPVFMESSFPLKSLLPQANVGKNISNSFINLTKQATLAIKILDPIELHEHLNQFVHNWFDPVTNIYQASSGIIGGIIGFFIAKIRQKNTNSNPDLKTNKPKKD